MYEDRIQAIPERFREAMDDDFNTAGALGALSDAFSLLNEYCDKAAEEEDPRPLARSLTVARGELLEVTEVLGLLREEPERWIESDEARGTAEKGIDPEWVERMLSERSEARKSRDFAKADAIRDELAEKGVTIKDTPQGTEWSV